MNKKIPMDCRLYQQSRIEIQLFNEFEFSKTVFGVISSSAMRETKRGDVHMNTENGLIGAEYKVGELPSGRRVNAGLPV